MAPTGDKASDMERRVSTRMSARISLDAIDEDYDLAVEGMVSDGFRPRGLSPSTPSLNSGSPTLIPGDNSPTSTSTTDRPTATPKFQMILRSSSANDEPSALTRQATGSTESTVYYPRDGPYQGPSVPSHPYQMYPQNVRPSRTMSTATTSTAPLSESSYSGPRGPSHPYALYPQSDGVGVEVDAAQTAPIPLGFHGLPDQYRRRTGPEGDDVADIIGPDGHTEQLPPYTRYPDEAYARKVAAVDGPLTTAPGGGTSVPPIQTTSAAAVSTIPGAGGIGLATRDPEFESTDDLDTPRSRQSTRSFASDDSDLRINTEEGVSEKRPPPKKWQIWMRRKLCGVVPYWALCLTIAVLVIMAAVLGAVIGVFLGRQRRSPLPPHRDGAWEPTFDAAPLSSTPSDIQPPPTGTYSLAQITGVSTPPNTCFQNPSLAQAWSCFMTSGLHINVSRDNRDYRASLETNHSYTLASNVYSYGEQPPAIPKPANLSLVTDRLDPNRGPAWYTLVSFNKTVIVPEGLLSFPNAKQKARHFGPPGAGVDVWKRKGIALPGEKAWICTWPETYLELFIYTQQNSTVPYWPKPNWVSSGIGTSGTSSTTPSSSSSSSSSSSTTASITPTPHGAQAAYESSDSNTYPMPAWAGGQSQPNGHWPHGQAHAPGNTQSSAPTAGPGATTSSTLTTTTTITSTSSPSSSTTTSTGPFGRIDANDTIPTPLPRYPKVVKLEERRISTDGAPRARCTQVEIQAPGQEARPVLHDGKPLVVDVQETEALVPPTVPTPTANVGRRSSPSDYSPCGCIWYLT